MSSKFSSDFKEYELMDNYASKYHRTYGVPNFNEVQWHARPTTFKRIDPFDAEKNQPSWNSKKRKAKDKTTVTQKDREKISLNKI